MELEKWQALGNDYLIIERSQLPFALSRARIRRLCAPHFGLGADGILLVERLRGQEPLVGSLRIFNPDGSEAELSGNGAREAALYMHAHGWAPAARFGIQTPAGVVHPEILPEGFCRMGIGRASLRSADFPEGPADGRGTVEVAGEALTFQHVSIGNPQCAIAIESEARLRALDLAAIGPAIEADPRFPNRTNVSFYAARSPQEIRARIFERGVGETLSSGTGAAGAAVAHTLAGGGGERTVRVLLDGGELLVEVGADLELHQRGWAVPVYKATLAQGFLGELAALDQEQGER